MPDALSAKLRDPDLLAMAAATGEGTADHLRNSLQIAAGIRDRLEDLDADLALALAALERRLLLALITDSRTLKVTPVADLDWNLDYGEPRGPRLVVDQTVCDEEDGA